MKRLLGMLLILFIFYFVFQTGFLYFGGGHTIEYDIRSNGKRLRVKETLTQNQDNEVENYYIEISAGDHKFDFQIFEKYYGRTRILEDLYYYEDDKNVCLFPVFIRGDILKDAKCLDLNDGIYYDYRYIKTNNSELASFMEELPKYNQENFVNDTSDPIREGRILLYPNNIVDNHFVGLNSYKGVYTISNNNLSKIVEIPLFSQDVYSRKINATVGRFYTVANYNERREFAELYTIDLVNNRRDTIPYRNSISFDSYIQGVRGDSIYLFDRSDSSQYRINPSTRNINLVGGVEAGLIKYDGLELQERVDAFEAIREELKFKIYVTSDNPDFDFMVDNKFESTGYVYYLKRSGRQYKVYRSSKQNLEMKKYLFDLPNLDDVYFMNNFIYFISGDEIKYYSDVTGMRTLLKNSELEFNNDIHFGVYIR